MSALSALAEAGIQLRHPDRLGEQRAPCPRCERGPKDDALAVRLESAGGATWYCHRCGWFGGTRNGINERPQGGAKPTAWAEAAVRAREILSKARSDPSHHPYVLKKRVPFGPLVRRGPWPQRGWPDALLIPVYGIDGAVWSVQAVGPEGQKDYLRDGRKQGGFHPAGDIRGAKRILVAEGLANLAAARKAVPLPGVAAMDSGNLDHAARSVRSINPNVQFVFVADNDVSPDGKNPGVEKAIAAARALGGLVCVPELDGRKCDMWDVWAERGAEAMRGCIERATAPGGGAAGHCGHEAVYRCLSDIEPKPIRWLWPGRIARGKVFMLAGHPGLGKSQAMLSMASIVSNGGTWPVDRTPCERGSVIILSAEDDAEDTIRPRLEAAGADLERVYLLDAVRETNKDGTKRPFNLTEDIDRLGDLARKLGDVALIVIDPVTAYLGHVDSHRNAEVRAVLAPLAEMAAGVGAAIVCVSHLTKAGGPEAMMRVMGSLGFVAAARGAYLVAKDPEDGDRRLFLPMKNNLAEDRGGLAFRVRGRDLGNGIETSCVEWDSDPVTITADEALVPAANPEDGETTAKAEAEGWLRDTLEGRDSMDGKLLKELARDSEIKERTLYRAANAIGVVMLPGGFGKPRQWHLCPMSAKGCHVCLTKSKSDMGRDGTHGGKDGPPKPTSEEDSDIEEGVL